MPYQNITEDILQILWGSKRGKGKEEIYEKYYQPLIIVITVINWLTLPSTMSQVCKKPHETVNHFTKMIMSTGKFTDITVTTKLVNIANDQ